MVIVNESPIHGMRYWGVPTRHPNFAWCAPVHGWRHCPSIFFLQRDLQWETSEKAFTYAATKYFFLFGLLALAAVTYFPGSRKKMVTRFFGSAFLPLVAV